MTSVRAATKRQVGPSPRAVSLVNKLIASPGVTVTKLHGGNDAGNLGGNSSFQKVKIELNQDSSIEVILSVSRGGKNGRLHKKINGNSIPQNLFSQLPNKVREVFNELEKN